MRAWDMRPYAPQNRCVKVFTGHQHSFERNSLRCDWSPDGTKVGFLPLLLSHTASFCLRLLPPNVTRLYWVLISPQCKCVLQE